MKTASMRFAKTLNLMELNPFKWFSSKKTPKKNISTAGSGGSGTSSNDDYLNPLINPVSIFNPLNPLNVLNPLSPFYHIHPTSVSDDGNEEGHDHSSQDQQEDSGNNQNQDDFGSNPGQDDSGSNYSQDSTDYGSSGWE